jgi:hypothetical protein
MRERWGLLRAASYGFVAMMVVFAFDIAGIRLGSRAPDPWLNINIVPYELIGYWGGYFASGPILFVLIAAVRNLFVKKR